MFDEASEARIFGRLREHSRQLVPLSDEVAQVQSFDLEQEDLHRVKVQLAALGLTQQSVRRRGVNDKNTYWTHTPYGESHLMRLNAIRREPVSEKTRGSKRRSKPKNAGKKSPSRKR